MNEDIAISSTGKKYYRGMLCTVDCSGHKAGYEWAYYNDVTDEDECINVSNSFTEGCLKGVEDVNDYE